MKKKAEMIVAAFDVPCPKCGEGIASPTGSLMWAVNEGIPTQVECHYCKEIFQVKKGWAK